MLRRLTCGILSAALLAPRFAPAADAPTPPSAPPPLTLDEAIRLALARNSSIKVQSFSRDIARANVLAAYGQFDPSLNFQRSYSQSDNPALASPDTGLRSPATFTQTDNYSLSLNGLLPWGLGYSLGGSAINQRGNYNAFRNNFDTFGGISITQPLLRGFGLGANLSGIRLAKADRSIADWTFRQLAIDTVARVIVAYNELAFARENLRGSLGARDRVAQLLAENEKRAQVGTLSASDVIVTRAQVANAESAIPGSERYVQASENALRQLIGEKNFAFAGTAPLVIEPPAPAEFVTVTPATDLQIAYALRPDYQAARLGVKKGRIGDTAAHNQLLPRVDFVGSYGYNGNDDSFATSRQLVRNEDYRAYSAGVVVSVPLTFAQGRGQARAARLALRQAEENVVRVEQQIAVDVADAAGQIEATQKRVQTARTALDLARQALDAEMKKFRAGYNSSTYFVIDRQDRYSSSELSLYRALTDHHQALAAYDEVLGRTLERHHITLANE
jgi:outer membrane protein TolC